MHKDFEKRNVRVLVLAPDKDSNRERLIKDMPVLFEDPPSTPFETYADETGVLCKSANLLSVKAKDYKGNRLRRNVMKFIVPSVILVDEFRRVRYVETRSPDIGRNLHEIVRGVRAWCSSVVFERGVRARCSSVVFERGVRAWCSSAIRENISTCSEYSLVSLTQTITLMLVTFSYSPPVILPLECYEILKKISFLLHLLRVLSRITYTNHNSHACHFLVFPTRTITTRVLRSNTGTYPRCTSSRESKSCGMSLELGRR